MTTPEEDLRRLADALAERVVVPPFAVVEARRRRRRARLVAVPVLTAAAVAFGAVAVHALRSPSPSVSAGTPTSSPTTRHSAVAAEPVRSCGAGDLRGSFTLGSRSAGQRFGQVEVRNVAATPCSPGATVEVGAGTAARYVLTSGEVPEVVLDHGHGLVVQLAGPERDDPTQPDGLCRAVDRVAPSQLVLTFAPGVTVTVRDAALRGLATCHGDLAVTHVEASVA